MGRGPSATNASRRFAALLLAVVLPSTAAIVWLGLRQLSQDRALVAQRDFERRQAAAPALVRAFGQILERAESGFGATAVPDGIVRVRVSPALITVEPVNAAAWLPVLPGEPEANARAETLLALARGYRQATRWDQALAAYRQLATITTANILGAPADLQARRWTCDVLKDAGRAAVLDTELASLARDLSAGKWTLDRETWEFVTHDFQRKHGWAIETDAQRLLVAEVVDSMWRGQRAGAPPTSGSSVFRRSQAAALLLVRSGPDRSVALLFPLAMLAQWTSQAASSTEVTGAVVSLLGESGEVLSGSPMVPGASAVTVTAAESGLPFTVALATGDVSDLVAQSADRRRLLLAGLLVPLALLAGGSLFAWRVMRRELAVSRLKTEFVAAVSHEFRTPLASLRHVTELLDEADDLLPDQRRRFYATLARNTDRLQGLVESLLDFSRMESGRKVYELRDVDAGALASEVVEDFRTVASPCGAVVTLDATASDCTTRADEASLSIALWNLLDNAVKYSVAPAVIDVRVWRQGTDVAISVRDRGIGILPGERQSIFERFVRGEQAARLGVKGTGLGLALVSHIVEGHGGSVRVQSEEGRGSEFTIVLPEVHS